MVKRGIHLVLILVICQLSVLNILGQSTGYTQEELSSKFRKIVTPQSLYKTVEILSSDEYEGRLTGHEGYDKSATWVIEKLSSWGVEPLGDDEGYLQYFPHPYTDVFPGCELILHPGENKDDPKKNYEYVEEYIPGSTSGNGEITAEVIYVGYGITAPELGYDDYAGLDVKGKIVLFEREVPLNPSHTDFPNWRPYSFHQYKLMNAVKHGAAGMLYNYHIANPNNAYAEELVYSSIGETVMEDIFHKTGKKPEKTVKKIIKKLKPRSFYTGKTFTIKNNTKHHPEGIGSNVIGYIEGSDPALKDEYILVGGHLDHLGKCYTIMPGAHDNATAVSVTMGLAEALSKSGPDLKRSVVFILMGAEEAALKGVQYFLKNPTTPSLDNIKGYINMDGVGIGDKIHVSFAENYPSFYAYLEEANNNGLNIGLSGSYNSNISRPRLDAAFFDWYGIPVLSIYSMGEPEAYSNYRYHTPYDNMDNITPDIMAQLAELLYISIINMANDDQLDIERGDVQEAFIK